MQQNHQQPTQEGAEQKLWAMFFPGPDELQAMPSKEAADAATAQHNKAIEESKLAERYDMPEDAVRARVVEWPYDAESHATALEDQEGIALSNNALGIPDCIAAAVAEKPMQLNIDARALPVLALFTTTLSSEYVTNHILCMPHPDGDGILLAATNRRTMVVLWHDPDGTTYSKALIPVPEKSALERIMKLCRDLSQNQAKHLRYTVSDGRHSVNNGQLYSFSVQQDDTLKAMPEPEIFPDIFRIIPKETTLVNGLHGRVPTKTLRRFSKAANLALQAIGLGHVLGTLDFWSVGDGGNGIIVARCHAVPNLLMISTVMAEEGARHRKPYTEGFSTMFPEETEETPEE